MESVLPTPTAVPSGPAVLREVCHELRTPVAAIAALASTLLGQQVAPADRTAASRMVAEHAQHLSAVLESLTDLAGGPQREPAGREVARTWLPGLVLAAADAAGVPAHLLDLDIASGARHVVVDRTALRQVLTNLLDNAERHAPGAPVEVRARRPGRRLELAVGDRGPGLDPRGRRRLAEGRGPAPSGPVGVGWAVIRREVERLRGRVQVDARPGGGLLVVLELPVR